MDLDSRPSQSGPRSGLVADDRRHRMAPTAQQEPQVQETVFEGRVVM